MSKHMISIYLNDHLAIMSAESELIQRTARANPATPLSECLWEIFTELRQKKDAVASAIGQRGGQVSLIKQNAAWLLEKLGRLKFNGSVATYSDLSRVVELEALIASTEARRIMWDVLIDSTDETDDARNHYEDFREKTGQSLDALRHHHREAAQSTFSLPGSIEESVALPEEEPQDPGEQEQTAKPT